MFNVGETVVWYPGCAQQSERYGDNVLVKVLRVTRNGITIEVPLDNGETQKIRVGRDNLRHPAPRPYRPRGRPTLWVVHPQEDVLENERMHRWPHLSRAGWKKKRLELIEMASAHGF
jgi:hypothetical protein